MSRPFIIAASPQIEYESCGREAKRLNDAEARSRSGSCAPAPQPACPAELAAGIL
jgi:hypothetical protein